MTDPTRLTLSERELYALRFLAEHYHPNHFLEAMTLAQQELREAFAAEDEEQVRHLRRKNRAIGWGHTLSHLTITGYVERKYGGGSWAYQINHRGRYVLAQIDAAPSQVHSQGVNDRDSLARRGRGEGDLGRDPDRCLAPGDAVRGSVLATEADEHRGAGDAEGPSEGDR